MGKPLENGEIMGIKPDLVGGLELFLCSHILRIIIPTDFHIFQKGLKPPTSIVRLELIDYLLVVSKWLLKMAIEIVDLPIDNGDFAVRYVNV